MDSAQPNPPQVLPPNRVLVTTSWTLGIAAVSLGVFGVACDLLQGTFSRLIYDEVSILLCCTVGFTLWARCGLLKSLFVWFAGYLGAVLLGVIYLIALRENSSFTGLFSNAVGPGIAFTCMAMSARLVSELILDPIREHPKYGVMLVLVVTGSLACSMLPFAIIAMIRAQQIAFSYQEIALKFEIFLLIPAGLLAYAFAAPFLIDKRRVPRIPQRIGIPIWIGWCILMPHFQPPKLRDLTAAIPILILFNSILLYLAWRNSRPKPPPETPTAV